jgi:hypothetical protein
MFTPILCPSCTAIVIVLENGPDRRCPCCQAAVHTTPTAHTEHAERTGYPEPEHLGELVPLPVRVKRPEAA